MRQLVRLLVPLHNALRSRRIRDVFEIPQLAPRKSNRANGKRPGPPPIGT